MWFVVALFLFINISGKHQIGSPRESAFIQVMSTHVRGSLKYHGTCDEQNVQMSQSSFCIDQHLLLDISLPIPLLMHSLEN